MFSCAHACSMFIRKAVLNNKKTRNFSMVEDKRSSERKVFFCGIVHSILNFYVDKIAFHQNSRSAYLWQYMFPEDWETTNLNSVRVPSAGEKKNSNKKIYMQNTCFLQQISICYHKYSLLMFVKPFARLLRYFSICYFIQNEWKILLHKNHLKKNTNNKQKMNVFNTWSIFGVCGISFYKI